MKHEQVKVTQRVVDFIYSADIGEFPHAVIDQGKRCLIDGIALMLAGSTADCSDILRKQIKNIAASDITIHATNSGSI